ncbi:hypothetical protein PIB30_077367, partial [Stylosanthes scabra]|nr:hypothetical protein [Stylosanthes scabra]
MRLSLRNKVSKAAATSHFFPGYGKTSDSGCKGKILLVLGATYGANDVNIAMFNLYYHMLRQNNSLYIYGKLGLNHMMKMESLVKNHPSLVYVA